MLAASCSVDVQNSKSMDVSCKLQCGCSELEEHGC